MRQAFPRWSGLAKMAPSLAGAVVAVLAVLLVGLVLAMVNEREIKAQKLREVGVQAEILADGQVQLTFSPAGVWCHMHLPLARKMQLAA